MNRGHKIFFVGLAGGIVALAGACSEDSTGTSSGSTSSGGSTSSSGGTTSSGGTSGSSGSSGSFSTCKSSGSSSNSCTQAELKTYNDCVLSKCDSAYKECYGPDYLKGTYSGACGDTITCYQKCDCTDFTCLGACKPSDACTTCSQKISACSKECTAPECLTKPADAGSSSGGDSGATGSCATLSACCAKLSGQEQSTCQQAAGLNNAQVCDAALTQLGAKCN